MIRIGTSSEQGRFHYTETGAAWRIASVLLRHIPFGKRPVRFVCIGTDRSTGDAYGPLTGTALTDPGSFRHPVLGTLDMPVHALNLQRIAETEGDVFTVAIDACLGRAEHIGQIVIEDRPLFPGRAVGKTLPPIGDLSIKGVVNAAAPNSQEVLQNTRLHLPFMMSRVTARAISLACCRHETKPVQESGYESHDEDARDEIGHPDLRQPDQV
ncbi:putative sporulation protein YyaC [Bhargavaea ginsengi]|uniref:Putative sporulation protein YyaC n=1 Tax=Bhargavaea ginsengi TaxID=426757 RepID=A0A1H7A329_9BACL|nr:spore protease YyaC [Bhargavaea ginsengi]SEJ56270.1 putative sporulation protein YyaC [Bhargavaea ginsengi]